MAQYRIAVADDEPDMRAYLRRLLEHMGFLVLGPVENGQQLVDLCLAQRPDLVITDIRMPVMNGDQAMETILAQQIVPFIVISAFGPAEIQLDELRDVPWVHLNKPIQRRDLEAAVHRLLSS